MEFLDLEQSSERIIMPTRHGVPNTWVEIELAALEHNLLSYKAVIGTTLLAPVIKSNAYGHGMHTIARILDQRTDVGLLCVASLSEAIALRSIGIQKPLLVLSIIDAPLQGAVAHNIDIIAYDLETACDLNRIAQTLNKKAMVHIKVDTGLSRLGLLKDSAILLIQTVHHLSHVTVHGIFTHFAFAESADQTYTNHQIKQFNELIENLEALGISIPLRHTASSAATTANYNSHYTMARVGIGMYGLWPSPDNRKLTEQNHPGFSLKSILTWKTRIIQIKEISAGSFVGYDLTFQATRTTRIATLPVGYWDGYDRRLTNKGMVLINNRLAHVVGIVAMNLTMIDVTDIQVSIGDEVTLIGNHPGVTADDMAKLCGTINYEIVTRINPLVDRVIK